MGKEGVIETGVDKLINLVERKKRISINDAVKELAVPKVVLEEWINFLEEKEIISIEYKFTTAYIVKKKMTQKDVEKKKKEFVDRKEGFLRKIESALTNIKKEGEWVSKLKLEFQDLGKQVEKDVHHVEADLEVLQKYEEMKRRIDKDIVTQQHEFETKISKVKTDILEDIEKYHKLIESTRQQEIQLHKDKKRAEDIKKSEDNIKENLVDISNALNIIKEELAKQEKVIIDDKKMFDNLKDSSEKIRKVLEDKALKMNQLQEESEKHADAIYKSQSDILKKVLEKRKTIEDSVAESKKIKTKFESFFNKKNQVDSVLNQVNREVLELESELKKMSDEIKILQLDSGKGSVDSHMKDLNNKFNEFRIHQQKLESDVGKLSDMVKD